MIDLDNEIIEMVVALESIAAVIGAQPSRLVVVAAVGIFTPGILGPDRPAGQESAWSGMAVGAKLSRAKCKNTALPRPAMRGEVL